MMIGIPAPVHKNEDDEETNVFVFGFNGIEVTDKFDIEVPCPGLIHEETPFPWIDNPHTVNFSYWVGLVTKNEASIDSNLFVVEFDHQAGSQYYVSKTKDGTYYYRKQSYANGSEERKLMTTTDVRTQNRTKMGGLEENERTLIQKALNAMGVESTTSSYKARTTNIFGMKIGDSKVCKLKMGRKEATRTPYDVAMFHKENWADVQSSKEYINWNDDEKRDCKRLPHERGEKFKVQGYEMNQQEIIDFKAKTFVPGPSVWERSKTTLYLELTDQNYVYRYMGARFVGDQTTSLSLWFDNENTPAVISLWNSTVGLGFKHYTAYAINCSKDDIKFDDES